MHEDWRDETDSAKREDAIDDLDFNDEQKVTEHFIGNENKEVASIELTMPDGSIARWGILEIDDRTLDRLTDAIESIMGKPDSINL